jgi:hypothetical protein
MYLYMIAPDIPNPKSRGLFDPKETGLESIPEIWMFISQLHPSSRVTVFILDIFFQ